MNLKKKGIPIEQENATPGSWVTHFYYDRRRPDGCGKDHFKISTVRIAGESVYIVYVDDVNDAQTCCQRRGIKDTYVSDKYRKQ
jgi:hypothetical protein